MCELSIIVPIYNVDQWLEKCLDSILAQTWGDFEVVCVDDGSTDRCSVILEKYRMLDGRIRVIRKENGGLVSARKAGVSAARGKYAAYVDADDWIDKEMYQCLMEKALETNADIVTSGLILEYADGRITELEEMEEGEYTGERLEKIFYPNMISLEEFFTQTISIHIFNKIYKTELLKRNQMKIPDHITIGEDAACVYPICLEADSIYVLNQAFYHYRMRNNSMMGICGQEENSYRVLYSYLKTRFDSFSYRYLQEQLESLIAYNILLIQPDILWKNGQMVPYKNIEKGKIILYGMGRFGKAFKKAIEETEGYEVIALADKNRRTMESGERCYGLQELAELNWNYDYVLVTILKRNICRSVKSELLAAGMEEKKIREPDGEMIHEAVRLLMEGYR